MDKTPFIQDPLINYSIFSTSVLQTLIDNFPRLVNEHKIPSLVFILSGGNDCDNEPDARPVLKKIKDLRQLIKSYSSKIRICYAHIEQRFYSDPKRQSKFMTNSKAINNFICRQVKRKSGLIDRAFLMRCSGDKLKPLYLPDGVHTIKQEDINLAYRIHKWIGRLEWCVDQTTTNLSRVEGEPETELPNLLTACGSPGVCQCALQAVGTYFSAETLTLPGPSGASHEEPLDPTFGRPRHPPDEISIRGIFKRRKLN